MPVLSMVSHAENSACPMVVTESCKHGVAKRCDRIMALKGFPAFAADVNLLKVPNDVSVPDERVLFLSDILSTAWHANELGQVSEGDKVAIWGAGPGFVLFKMRVAYSGTMI